MSHPFDFNSALRTFSEQGGHHLDLVVDRTVMDPSRQTTFSAEAVETMAAQMRAWTLSRLLRATLTLDEPPPRLRLALLAETDGDNVTAEQFVWEREWMPTVGDERRHSAYSRDAHTAVEKMFRGWLITAAAGADGRGDLAQRMTLVLDVHAENELGQRMVDVSDGEPTG